MPADAAPPYDGAYQGEPGAYSEQAAVMLLGASARLLPLPSLEQVVAAAGEGRARTAIVPVENSLAGTVPQSYELLLDSALRVGGETVVAIDHVLVAPPATPRDHVRRVFSHPVALAQCREFFRRHPHIEPVPAFDTAGAAAAVVRARDGVSAAIASRRAASLHGAVVLEEDIQDHPENRTRFLLLSAAGSPPARTGAASKALIAFGLPHTPGALARALAPLGDAGLNLTRIESRAIHGRPFEYQFVAELVAASGRQGLDAAVDTMAATTVWRRVLGVFSTAG